MRILWREIFLLRNIPAAELEMANFRVEVLLKALDELQNEKSLNEQVLTEEYAKRKKLETEVEKNMSMLSRTSEKHARISESVKMEEQRVEHAQGQINKFEQVNDAIRDRIAKLNHQIKQTKEEQQYSMDIFDVKMSQLIDIFRSTWKETEEDNKVNYFEEQKSKLGEWIEDNERKLQSLREQMNKELERQPAEITSSEMDDVCKLFQAENIAAKIALEKKEQELCLEDLEKKLAILLEGRQGPREP